ncbi:transketolase [uncultured Kriegella sp.]|uniref:transketolase n=1 Tax=uncultured Kriegella sp. TaxID=1798910 RepID=UPI0030D829E4|tara:strand:+ start:164171 stop:165133 length:963 start_codon:yes stop_codon:yes gene_type:complete
MFFDIQNINKGYAADVKRLLERGKPFQAIQSPKDLDLLNYLGLAAIDHRRMLLQLGQKHKIRLHYGACMSMVEIITILYLYWLNIDPEKPDWDGRDRFVLSKGHAVPSLYITLLQSGYVSDRDFEKYRTIDSIFQGHPDRNKTPGIDCSTGSLGQGFPVACGMAWALKKNGSSAKVYSLLSDGECNEGSVWEAALIAHNARLDNLISIIDYNKKSSYGSMKDRNAVSPLSQKWESFGWNVLRANGHDFEDLSRVLKQAHDTKGRPSIIICDTIKGKGIPLHTRQFVSSSSGLDESHYEEAIVYLNNLEKKINEESGTRIR